MSRQPLTARQSEVLELVRNHLAAQGCPPTRAEIAVALGFRSPNAAEDHLRALERKGYVDIVAGSSRGIRLLDDHPGLPVIGRVAAGEPILAEQHIEDYCQLDPELFHPPADYLLRVRGDSMKEAGILPGDLLAVHRTPSAQNGQIIVARLDDEVTVKRFRQRGAIIRLLPENPDYAPIRIDLRRQTLVIEGRAVGVLRKEV
ncbi:MAG: transcriptional repressor LexA [Gammaproteobacteria bacterium]|jgi:repressor LexA